MMAIAADAHLPGMPFSARIGGWVRRNGLIAPALAYAIIVTQAPFLLTIRCSLSSLSGRSSAMPGARNSSSDLKRRRNDHGSSRIV